jgi:hypothetical protein
MIVGAEIKFLSNEVTLQTATVVKEFFELCAAADAESSYIALPPDVQKQLVALNRSIGRVARSQNGLLQALDKVSDELLTHAQFPKVISDLALVVAQVESAISETYAAPQFVASLVRKNLETVADQNSHLDSYAESFRAAFDENCTALLADLAGKIIAG